MDGKLGSTKGIDLAITNLNRNLPFDKVRLECHEGVNRKATHDMGVTAPFIYHFWNSFHTTRIPWGFSVFIRWWGCGVLELRKSNGTCVFLFYVYSLWTFLHDLHRNLLCMRDEPCLIFHDVLTGGLPFLFINELTQLCNRKKKRLIDIFTAILFSSAILNYHFFRRNVLKLFNHQKAKKKKIPSFFLMNIVNCAEKVARREKQQPFKTPFLHMRETPLGMQVQGFQFQQRAICCLLSPCPDWID